MKCQCQSLSAPLALNASADANVINSLLCKLHRRSCHVCHAYAASAVASSSVFFCILHIAQKRSAVANPGILQPRYPNARCIKRTGFRRTSRCLPIQGFGDIHQPHSVPSMDPPVLSNVDIFFHCMFGDIRKSHRRTDQAPSNIFTCWL